MTQRFLKAAVLLGILFAFVFLAPGVPQSAAHAAMDSTVRKSVRLPILMYHSLLKDPKKADVFVLTPDGLESDLKYLQANGFETVVVKDLIDYVDGQRALPEKPVMITFDDGHYNVLTYALPILEKMDMRAVLSVVGAYAEKFTKNPDPNPNYAYLSWDEIRYLKDTGRFEIQNHSYAMHTIGDRKGSQRKNGESETAYCSFFCSDALKQQIMLQEKCGVTPTAYTYPYGLISPEAQLCLSQMQFSASLTCYERINYIQAGNPDCLFGLGRFNRSGKTTTAVFMKMLLKEMK